MCQPCHQTKNPAVIIQRRKANFVKQDVLGDERLMLMFDRESNDGLGGAGVHDR